MSAGTSERELSLNKRLQAAQDALARATSAGSTELSMDAHLAIFDAYSSFALLDEAKAALAQAERLSQQQVDTDRMPEVVARQTTVALLDGVFERAERLLLRAPSTVQQYLLLREQGRQELTKDAVENLVAGDEQTGDQWLLFTAMAAEVAAASSDESGPTRYGSLLPFAGRLAVAGSQGSLGPIDRYLGLLAADGGRLDDAIEHLAAAVRISERIGSRPWAAHAQADLAAVLTRRDGTGDLERARQLVADARSTAQALGMTGLERDIGRLDREREAPRNLFRRSGEFWTVGVVGSTFTMRDTKGMHYLARLLAHPNVEVHVIDLVGGEQSGSASSVTTAAAAANDLSPGSLGDAGEILDAAAREQYRDRLEEIDAEIAEAEAWNDPERVARRQEEREFLIKELKAAVGLGGRARVAASAAERARVNVSKTVSSAIERISAQSPDLGRHLTLAIHTGTFCSYTPDPGTAIVWEL